MLPQASVTVQLLVVEKVHPLPVSSATVPVAVRPVLQLSDTEAEPKAAAISSVVGLQPRAVAATRVITGLVTSLVKVTVCKAVPVLPQLSVTVQLLVTEVLRHPVPEFTSMPTVPVAVKPVLQLSVTVDPPKAAAISSVVGLQPRAVAATRVITGSSVSLV